MMKKKIISCLVIVVVIVLSYFYAHIDKNSYLYDRNADTGTFDATGVLEDGEEIRQTFIADENSIDGINIKVNISGNVETVVLNCVLLDEAMQEVCHVNVAANELENNKFNKIDFPIVTETKGRQFTLVLREENSDVQNGVGFYYEPGSQEDQKLAIRGNETEGTMITRIICHRFDVETFVVLLGIIAFVVVFMKILYKYFK